MKFRTVFRIAALAAWLTAVTAYWWAYVPPPAEHVIPLQGRSTRWSPGFCSTIVLSQMGPLRPRPTVPGHDEKPRSFGPLQLYDPATGQQVRKALDANDEILAVVVRPRQLAITLRKGVVAAVDLNDPQSAIELAGVDPDSQFVFAEGARILIVDSKDQMTAFDLETGTRLWSRSDIRNLRPTEHGGTGVVRVEIVGVGSQRMMLYARTGEIDDRHDFIGGIYVSEDGRRFAMSSDQRVIVFDTSQQAELCRVPLMSPGKFPMVQLSPDGKQLRVWEHKSQPPHMTFWDCETGRQSVRQPGPNKYGGLLSPNGAWILNTDNIYPLFWRVVEKLPSNVITWLQRSPTVWDKLVAMNQPQVHLRVVTDTFTSETLGRYQVSSNGEWLMVTDDESGFVAFGGPTAIHCYRVPADRDWLWLLKWGAGPIAAAWSLLFLFRKWQQRRPAPSPGAAST